MDIWSQSQQQLLNGWFIKDCYVANTFKGGDNLGTFSRGKDWSALSLLDLDLLV
jgi:hypothetical protein